MWDNLLYKTIYKKYKIRKYLRNEYGNISLRQNIRYLLAYVLLTVLAQFIMWINYLLVEEFRYYSFFALSLLGFDFSRSFSCNEKG